jgi:hypothetical protein
MREKLIQLKTDKPYASILVTRDKYHEIYPDRAPRMCPVVFNSGRSNTLQVEETLAKYLVENYDFIHYLEAPPLEPVPDKVVEVIPEPEPEPTPEPEPIKPQESPKKKPQVKKDVKARPRQRNSGKSGRPKRTK